MRQCANRAAWAAFDLPITSYPRQHWELSTGSNRTGGWAERSERSKQVFPSWTAAQCPSIVRPPWRGVCPKPWCSSLLPSRFGVWIERFGFLACRRIALVQTALQEARSDRSECRCAYCPLRTCFPLARILCA